MNEINRKFRKSRGFGFVETLNGYTFTPEANAHTFRIQCVVQEDNLETAVPFETGSVVSARFLKSDHVTELVEGSLDENGAAVVTLPAECYAVPGRFLLTIFVAYNSISVCVYAATGTVIAADSSTVNVSENASREIDEKIAELNAAAAQVSSAISAGSAKITEINQAAAAARASIPQDYTALSDSVGDLKSAVINKAPSYAGHNRINPATCKSGIISSTGSIIANTTWSNTDYIEIVPGETLYAYNYSAANYALYDIDYNILTNPGNWSNPFTVPSNAYYLRITISTAQIGVGAFVSDVNYYTPYKTIIDVQDDINHKIDSIVKINELFTISGTLNKDYGTIATNQYYACTDFIPIVGIIGGIGYTVKTLNGMATACLYDENKSFISSVVSSSASLIEESSTITNFGNAKYIRFCSNIENGYIPELYACNLDSLQIIGKCINPQNATFYIHDEKTNMIDISSLSLGYINGDTDGSVHTSTTMYCTGFIPLDAEKQYYFNSNYLYGGYCAFYDASKQYIDGVGTKTANDYLPNVFTPPANTKYGRFTIASQSRIVNAWLCETNQMSTKPPAYNERIEAEQIQSKPTDYTGDDICIFNKILCIGDSLTDGFFNENGGSRLIIRNRSYPAKLQSITGIECTNMGYSGYTSAEWYNEYKNTDLSGHDACIIQLGVNDALNNVSESDMDTALTNIINKVKNENKGIKIFVATIIPGDGYMLTSMRTRSQMIRDFVANLNDSNVYLVDMWTYGHTDDLLAFDAGHLSAYGYLQLAMDYKAYISYIIRNNPNDFRYVQFIGTNYVYTGSTQVRDITY